MLRDELLRSKNDEIAYVLIFIATEIRLRCPKNDEFVANLVVRNCLSRRKRKLSALYLATVGFGATEDAHYHQKEQAFLDANDLSK